MTPIEEIASKRERIAAWLDRHGLDAVALSTRPNFAWLSAGACNHVAQATETGAATLLATKDKIVCVANSIEAPRQRTEELAGREIDVFDYPWYDGDAAARVWAEVIGGRRTAADVRVAGMSDAVTALPGDFAALRWAMTRAERRRYRVLGTEVGAALHAVCHSIESGQSEHVVAATLMERLQRRGIRTPVVLVAADERINLYRHPIPTDRRIERRVMAVVCGERHGLICSATRLVCFGPLSDELRQKHEAVMRVDAVLMTNTRPGRRLSEVFAAGQAAYAEAGYKDEWQQHHQGGATGYLSREVKATPTCDVVVQADQAFAWNPSIAGTKSEDTILVRQEGFEVLTRAVDWPMREVACGDTVVCRPAILVQN